MLKTTLKSGGRTPLAREHGLQVFNGVQQGINPSADRRWLLAAKAGPPIVELPTQFPPEVIDRLQCKGQPEFFGGGFDGKSGQQFHQPGPQARGGERVPWQHVRQHQGEGAPATAALAPIGTEDPLAPDGAPVGFIGIVAAQDAVPVQGFDLAAAGTALLLEGKSVSFNAGSSRTK